MELVTPGIGLLFWMLLSFTIVLLILRKFAWPAILEALKQRETKISNALSAAKRAEQEMEKLKADNEKVIQEAKLARDEILREARQAKEKIVQDAKAQATQEANRLIEVARTSIQNEKAAAIDEIKSQVTELSIEIAEKILSHELEDDSEHMEMIESLLKNLNMN